MAGNAGLKGTTYTFTDVDLSKLPAGSVGTYYLVNMPGHDAENVTPIKGNHHGSFAVYADAQGCAGWDGKRDAGQTCAPESGQKQGTNATAGEFDLFEANMYGFATTSHGCAYTDPNFTGTITDGSTTCNWGGNVLGVHQGVPTPGATDPKPLIPNGSPVSCKGLKGPDGLTITSDYYGPHETCHINTTKLLDTVEVAISNDASSFTTKITQGGNTLSGKQTTTKELQAQADLPWTILGTSWGGTTDWLDGQAFCDNDLTKHNCSGPSDCPSGVCGLPLDYQKQNCNPQYTDLKGNCNFAGVKAPGFTPTSMYCNGVGPDITADCPTDPSACCKKCGADWEPDVPRCVANEGVHLKLGGIMMSVK
jgi:hypothetical protein